MAPYGRTDRRTEMDKHISLHLLQGIISITMIDIIHLEGLPLDSHKGISGALVASR